MTTFPELEMLSTLQKIRQKIHQHQCENQLSEILTTPPAHYVPSDDLVVFSMIGKKYLSAYLVAVKSFLYWFNQASVHILNDGSLQDEEIKLLKHHVPGIQISHISEVEVGVMPRGGCWERIIKLIELSQSSYVIQLDSDIVVNGPISEIYNFVKNQSSFTIGNPRWSEPSPIDYIANVAKQWNSTHVQTAAEIAMPSLPLFKDKPFKMIRGCAGFAGFPKGAVSRQALEEFSMQMEMALGKKKWAEWGSEQVASNYLVSSCDNAQVLKWPQYQNYAHPISNEPLSTACVVHFMGTNRYDHGEYRRMAKKLITSLRNVPMQQQSG